MTSKRGGKSIHTKALYEFSSFVERWGISCHIAVSPYLWAFFSFFTFIPLSVPTSLLGDAPIPHLQPSDLEALFWEFSLRLSYVTERRVPCSSTTGPGASHSCHGPGGPCRSPPLLWMGPTAMLTQPTQREKALPFPCFLSLAFLRRKKPFSCNPSADHLSESPMLSHTWS